MRLCEGHEPQVWEFETDTLGEGLVQAGHLLVAIGEGPEGYEPTCHGITWTTDDVTGRWYVVLCIDSAESSV